MVTTSKDLSGRAEDSPHEDVKFDEVSKAELGETQDGDKLVDPKRPAADLSSADTDTPTNKVE